MLLPHQLGGVDGFGRWADGGKRPAQVGPVHGVGAATEFRLVVVDIVEESDQRIIRAARNKEEIEEEDEEEEKENKNRRCKTTTRVTEDFASLYLESTRSSKPSPREREREREKKKEG